MSLSSGQLVFIIIMPWQLLFGGQASITTGLVTTESLHQQDLDAGAGLYCVVWDETTQG